MESDRTKIACITGATSGIGAAFAKKFAEKGYNLIITGRRKEKIELLANSLSNNYKVNVDVVIAELSDDCNLDKLSKVIEEKKDLEVLVNNAGFTKETYFHKENIKTFTDMIKVHNLAIVKLCHSALPNMLAKRSGIIINVSSLGAFMPLPINAVYSASKSFIKLFSESIYLELKGSGVRIQSLCPGMTISDFHERLGYDKKTYYKEKGLSKAMSPEMVVEAALKCLAQDKAVCIPGRYRRILSYLIKLLPQSLLYKIVTSAKSIKDKMSDMRLTSG